MDITIFKDKLINKRNIILFAIVIILIIIALIMFFILKNREKEKLMPVEFSSNDSSISISVANEYEFSTVSDDSYKLVLKSAVTGSAIYFSEVSNTNVRDTLKLVEADKNDYISKFSNISQVSDVSETIPLLLAHKTAFWLCPSTLASPSKKSALVNIISGSKSV